MATATVALLVRTTVADAMSAAAMPAVQVAARRVAIGALRRRATWHYCGAVGGAGPAAAPLPWRWRSGCGKCSVSKTRRGARCDARSDGSSGIYVDVDDEGSGSSSTRRSRRRKAAMTTSDSHACFFGPC